MSIMREWPGDLRRQEYYFWYIINEKKLKTEQNIAEEGAFIKGIKFFKSSDKTKI